MILQYFKSQWFNIDKNLFNKQKPADYLTILDIYITLCESLLGGMVDALDSKSNAY